MWVRRGVDGCVLLCWCRWSVLTEPAMGSSLLLPALLEWFTAGNWRTLHRYVCVCVVMATFMYVLCCHDDGVLPQSVSYTGEVVQLRGHVGPVTSLCVCRPFAIAVSGSADRTAIIWDTNR